MVLSGFLETEAPEHQGMRRGAFLRVAVELSLYPEAVSSQHHLTAMKRSRAGPCCALHLPTHDLLIVSLPNPPPCGKPQVFRRLYHSPEGLRWTLPCSDFSLRDGV